MGRRNPLQQRDLPLQTGSTPLTRMSFCCCRCALQIRCPRPYLLWLHDAGDKVTGQGLRRTAVIYAQYRGAIN
jgi:hypothetical protein